MVVILNIYSWVVLIDVVRIWWVYYKWDLWGSTEIISIDLFLSIKYHGLSSYLSIFGGFRTTTTRGFRTCSLTLRQVPSNKVQVPEQYQLMMVDIDILVPSSHQYSGSSRGLHPDGRLQMEGEEEKLPTWRVPLILVEFFIDVISASVVSLLSSELLQDYCCHW